MAIKAILDTNLFVSGSITAEPPIVRSISSYSKYLGMDVFLPELCLDETIQKAKESYAAYRQKLSENLETWKTEIDSDASFKWHEEGEFLTKLEEKLRTFLNEHKIEVLNFIEKPPTVREMAAQAIKKNLPFDSSGNNFRDAVIVLVVEDVCKTLPHDEVWFVTKDNRFRDLLKKSDCKNLSVFNPDDVQKEIDSRLDKKMAEAIEEMKKEIRNYINSHLAEVTDFCKKNTHLSFTPSFNSEEVIAIKDLNVTSAEEIENFEFMEQGKAEPIHITVVLLAEVNVDVLTSQSKKDIFRRALSELASKPTKVGDEKAPKAGSAWIDLHRRQAGYYKDYVESQKRQIVLEIDGLVTYHDGEISDITLIRSKHSEKSFYDYRPLDLEKLIKKEEDTST